jgi:hypothetical protein
MLAMPIVMLNLVIAIMGDAYQIIQVRMEFVNDFIVRIKVIQDNAAGPVTTRVCVHEGADTSGCVPLF